MTKRIVLIVLLAFVVSGCGKFMGNLRRDLDDSDGYQPGPTIGGTWSERGMLQEDRFRSIGHSERAPASMAYEGGSESWISPSQSDESRRDSYRRAGGEDEGPSIASYSNNPSMPPESRRLYKNGVRATREDFIDNGRNEGSLWGSDGQTNYYFTKNKVRGLGDIVTIKVQADLLKDTFTEVTRTLSPKEREAELELAQERLRNKTLGIADAVGTSAAAPERAPAATEGGTAQAKPKEIDEDQIPKATYSDIDVGKSLDLKEGDTIMAEVVERFPNGNYKIHGVKRMRYRNGFRFMKVTAVVKSSDIAEDDTIDSGRLYEYRLEVIR